MDLNSVHEISITDDKVIFLWNMQRVQDCWIMWPYLQSAWKHHKMSTKNLSCGPVVLKWTSIIIIFIHLYMIFFWRFYEKNKSHFRFIWAIFIHLYILFFWGKNHPDCHPIRPYFVQMEHDNNNNWWSQMIALLVGLFWYNLHSITFPFKHIGNHLLSLNMYCTGL